MSNYQVCAACNAEGVMVLQKVCDFCGKNSRDVALIIAGMSADICVECVEKASDVALAELEARQASGIEAGTDTTGTGVAEGESPPGRPETGIVKEGREQG